MGYDFSHNSGFSSILRCLCACVPIVPMYVQQYLTTPSPHGHVNRPSDAFYSTCGVNLRMMRWQDTRVCFDPAKGHQDDEEGGYIMCVCVCVRVVLNSWCSITLWEKCWRGRRGRLGKHRAFRWIWWGFGGGVTVGCYYSKTHSKCHSLGWKSSSDANQQQKHTR